MVTNEIEHSYDFTLELENGDEEVIQVPRVTTRMKFQIGYVIQSASEDIPNHELFASLLEVILPDIMSRQGEDAPTIISLWKLLVKIIEVEGDNIFGLSGVKITNPQNPEKKEEQGKVKKRRGRPRKNRKS